jgi:glucose/arabinose dehydrogenase
MRSFRSTVAITGRPIPHAHRPALQAAIGAVLLMWVALFPSGHRAAGRSVASSEPSTGTSQSCGLVFDGYGPDGTVRVRAEQVVSGLEVPWGVAFLPEGGILITERPGRLRLVKGGKLQPAPVATIKITGSAEGGLMGLALHPDFRANHLFYMYYTEMKQGRAVNRVARWKLSADSSHAWLDRVILDDIPAARYHDGGRLRFGPDRMLYVGTGDARDPALSQDRGTPAGKILRLTPDGRVPADNPFRGSPDFIIGVRNTEGFDWWDNATLIVTDNGPTGELGKTGLDEVSVARAGDNLGWPIIYGCEARAGMVGPILSWEQAVPPGGAAIYRGSAIPEWRGSLLIGTLGSAHLHRVVLTHDSPPRLERHEVYFRNQLGRLREVIAGPDGALYVTTSNCDGRGECPPDKDKLLRIVAGR